MIGGARTLLVLVECVAELRTLVVSQASVSQTPVARAQVANYGHLGRYASEVMLNDAEDAWSVCRVKNAEAPKCLLGMAQFEMWTLAIPAILGATSSRNCPSQLQLFGYILFEIPFVI